MAKKAVATFAAKAGAKSMVKCIRMEKSPKTGAYVFTEQLVVIFVSYGIKFLSKDFQSRNRQVAGG